MTIQLFTRSSNSDLYAMMREFIPEGVECVQCSEFGKWWEAKTYLHHVLNESTADWIVNCDEDCFITDFDAVYRIIELMNANDLHFAGLPDGGVVHHRCRSWCVMNPCFNIFSAKEIKKRVMQKYPAWVIDSAGFSMDWEKDKPDIVKAKYNHDYVEPYSNLFYALYAECKPLYLNGYGHNDSISTMIQEPDGGTFAYHSWYARDFSTDPTQRQRILSLYEEAKSKKI